MNSISKVFPKTPILSMTLADFVEHISDTHSLKMLANEQFHSIESVMTSITNALEIKPLFANAHEELTHLLKDNVLTMESNTLFANSLKSMFLKLKNFFLKLIDAIVAFFKRTFDVNVRTRHTLNNQIKKFYMKRSTIADTRIAALSSFLITKEQFVEIHNILVLVHKDLLEAGKAVNADEASQFNAGISKLGYMVSNGVVIETTSTKNITPIAKRFGELGWTVENYIEASQTLAQLCMSCESANNIGVRLKNNLTAGMREIDRLNTTSAPDKAAALQVGLNDLSKRSCYVLKCAGILQSYVGQLSVQFVDTWENIINLTY